ncbi:unnamed protein product [Phyllotreta striolata]|uniref:Major facilitator superfamily (MFS) profile domain-containing protein n=1 Tax=Phyllotreta striolata TaxID=444603 RepID=A0A9N9XMQ1_PHYSR|nr:unnamed protein product [Phyllotreta striolata]
MMEKSFTKEYVFLYNVENNFCRSKSTYDRKDTRTWLNRTFAAIGTRHVQVLFMFALLTIGIGMRVQFSVALVAMTDRTSSKNPDVPVYDWNNKGVLLSSFFWGYAILQIVAALMARVHGSKVLLIASMATNAVICCSIPTVAKLMGSYGVMACRAIMGLAQGFFYPSIYGVLTNWVPSSERAHLGSSALAGVPFGIITGMSITGFISASWGGWPCSFYFYGMLGFLWIIGYYVAGASSPALHPKITEKEKTFIENDASRNETKAKVPWTAIMTSPAFWAIFFSYIGQSWGYQTLLSELPVYMNKVMKFNIETNGILSATPYLIMFIIIIFTGYFSDYLINNEYLTVKQSRCIFNSLATFGPAIGLVALSFMPETAVIPCVIMLIIAVGTQGASSSGFEINSMDISPNFAEILIAFSNAASEVFSNLGPLAVQFVVTDETNKAQWRIIFLAAAASYVLTSTIFIIFMRADVQPWNNTDKENDENKA